MITIRHLEDEELIYNALSLLYKSYIEDNRWSFNPSNPSNIRVEVKNGQNILIDRFTMLAKWFGAFDDKKLVGCFRLCGVDKDNKFEIEKYPIGTIRQYLLINRDKCVDINRVAVDSQYIRHGVTKRLFLKAFEYCNDNKSSIFACTHNQHLINFFQKINYPLKQEKAFKYETSDISAVNFYYASYRAGELAKIIKTLKEQLNKTM